MVGGVAIGNQIGAVFAAFLEDTDLFVPTDDDDDD